MTESSTHNPDRHMAALRQFLSQGRKRIGLLLGAGVPCSVRINSDGALDAKGDPLIPSVEKLTESALDALDENEKNAIESFRLELGDSVNIEKILTRTRHLSQVIGAAKVNGLNGREYENMAEKICRGIGNHVSASLPNERNSYNELVSWIGGIHRAHPVEIFTPNYDLLIEEALERAGIPYFDGFSGSHMPFFDSASISDDKLPARWARVWKIHGSLGWEVSKTTSGRNSKVTIVRTGARESTGLIYPDHMKYDLITKLPYSALFERLGSFLRTPDSLLLCSGFSFSDAHIVAVLGEAMSTNGHTAIWAFQYNSLDDEKPAVELANRCPNMSVFASDGAIVSGVRGKWGQATSIPKEWREIRQTYWGSREGEEQKIFLLGNFKDLAHFMALSISLYVKPNFQANEKVSEVDDENSEIVLESNVEEAGEVDDA